MTPVLDPNSGQAEPHITGTSAINLQAYSRFKYGDSTVAQQYGRLIAERMVPAYPALLDHDVVYVAPSAYKVTPTAASTLLDSCIDRALRCSLLELCCLTTWDHEHQLQKLDHGQPRP